MDKETESKAVGVIGNGLIHYPFDFMECDGKYFFIISFHWVIHKVLLMHY